MSEVSDAAEIIYEAADTSDANIIFGAFIDPRLDGEVRITVLATGFDDPNYGKEAVAKVSEPEEVKDEAPSIHEVATPEFVPENELDIPAFLRRR